MTALRIALTILGMVGVMATLLWIGCEATRPEDRAVEDLARERLHDEED